MHFYINVAQVWGLGIITVVLGIAAYTVIETSIATKTPIWRVLGDGFDRIFR